MDRTISSDMQEKIISILEERGVSQPCPRCGNENFVLSDGYAVLPVHGKLQGLTIGGRSIPCIITICTKCGFLSMHALGTLGLMDEAKK